MHSVYANHNLLQWHYIANLAHIHIHRKYVEVPVLLIDPATPRWSNNRHYYDAGVKRSQRTLVTS